MTSILTKLYLKARLRAEEGATAVEYGLMVALIAIAIVTAVTLLGGNLSTLYNNVANRIGGLPNP